MVHDLNADPVLPFPDGSFDDAVCCVSVDYLVRPIEVFAEVARVVRPGGHFVCTFSNRCFPTKAIRGWLHSSDAEHGEIVAEYFRRSDGFDEPVIGAAALRRGTSATPSGRCGRPSLDSPTHEGLPTRRCSSPPSPPRSRSWCKVRSKGPVPPTSGGGWRELQGPDFR